MIHQFVDYKTIDALKRITKKFHSYSHSYLKSLFNLRLIIPIIIFNCLPIFSPYHFRHWITSNLTLKSGISTLNKMGCCGQFNENRWTCIEDLLLFNADHLKVKLRRKKKRKKMRITFCTQEKILAYYFFFFCKLFLN